MKPSPSNHLSKLYFRNIKLIHQSAMAVIFLCYLLFAGVLPFAVADTLQELGDRLISNTELNTPQKKVAEVVFKICSTFPDPANDSQQDFLNRCSEVVVHGMESEKAAALFQMDTIETDTMGTATVEINAYTNLPDLQTAINDAKKIADIRRVGEIVSHSSKRMGYQQIPRYAANLHAGHVAGDFLFVPIL